MFYEVQVHTVYQVLGQTFYNKLDAAEAIDKELSKQVLALVGSIITAAVAAASMADPNRGTAHIVAAGIHERDDIELISAIAKLSNSLEELE